MNTSCTLPPRRDQNINPLKGADHQQGVGNITSIDSIAIDSINYLESITTARETLERTFRLHEQNKKIAEVQREKIRAEQEHARLRRHQDWGKGLEKRGNRRAKPSPKKLNWGTGLSLHLLSGIAISGALLSLSMRLMPQLFNWNLVVLGFACAAILPSVLTCLGSRILGKRLRYGSILVIFSTFACLISTAGGSYLLLKGPSKALSKYYPEPAPPSISKAH